MRTVPTVSFTGINNYWSTYGNLVPCSPHATPSTGITANGIQLFTGAAINNAQGQIASMQLVGTNCTASAEL